MTGVVIFSVYAACLVRCSKMHEIIQTAGLPANLVSLAAPVSPPSPAPTRPHPPVPRTAGIGIPVRRSDEDRRCTPFLVTF